MTGNRPGLDPMDYDPFRDFDDDDDDDEFFDCSMGPDGHCGQAGTEWCDWECPVMAEMRGLKN